MSPEYTLERKIERVLFVTFLATLVFVPLLWGAPRPMYWWFSQVAIQAISIASLGLVLLFNSPFGSISLPARVSLSLLTFVFLYVLIVQLLLGVSITPHETTEQLIKTLCLIQVFALTLFFIKDRTRLILLISVLVYSGAFQAIYGIAMTITGLDLIWHKPKEVGRGLVSGTFVNRNHMAGYLEMTLALGIGLMIAKLDRKRTRNWRQWLRGWSETLLSDKVRIRTCLVLMVIALILTRSRMGNTAFMVSLAIIAVIGILVFRRSSRPVVILFASLLVFDVVVLGSVVGIQQLQERLEKTTVASVQVDHRTMVSTLSIEGIKDNPVFGTGLGSWYSSFPQYRDHRIVPFYRYAHNDYVQFTSELGLVGVIPLGLVVLLSLGQSIRTLIGSRSVTMKSLHLGFVMGISVILIHSIADFNLQLFPNALTFMVILALCQTKIETMSSDRQ